MTFIGLLTNLYWPVMIAEIIHHLTIVPTVMGSNLGWSSAASFYSITYITRCPIGIDRFSIMAIKESSPISVFLKSCGGRVPGKPQLFKYIT